LINTVEPHSEHRSASDIIHEMSNDLQNEKQEHQAAVNTLKEYIVALSKVEKILLESK
jgi:hypothetical protein